MNTKILILSTMLVAASGAAWAATRCTINNRNSQAIYVEVRAGNKQNCESNPVIETQTIRGNSSISVPYGGGITHVCARERLDNGWAGWHVTGCPSSDNSLCYINM